MVGEVGSRSAALRRTNYRAEVVVLGFKNLGLDEVLHGLIGAQRLCSRRRLMAPQTRAAAHCQREGAEQGEEVRDIIHNLEVHLY